MATPPTYAVTDPIHGQWSQGDWWTNSNLSFDQAGQGGFNYLLPEGVDSPLGTPGTSGAQYANQSYATQNLEVPEWAVQDTPAAFYDWYQNEGGNQPGVQATLVDTLEKNKLNEEARQSSLAFLQGGITDLTSAYEVWQADPYRMAALEGYQRRLEPGYSVVSPEEERAMDLRIAQSTQSNLARTNARAGGRGVASGGANLGTLAGIQGQALAAEVGVDAQIASANEQARLMATQGLGALSAQQAGIDLAYNQGLAQYTGAQANVEAGQQFNPTDFTAFGALQTAQERWEVEDERFNRALASYEKSQEFDLGEWLIDDVAPLVLGQGFW